MNKYEIVGFAFMCSLTTLFISGGILALVAAWSDVFGGC